MANYVCMYVCFRRRSTSEIYNQHVCIGFAKYLFFGNVLEKKLLKIFSNFFLYLKVQSLRLIMENNFIQMAALTGHAVDYTIGTIFKHIIDCVQLYFTNGFTNIEYCPLKRQLPLACRRNTYL